MSKQETQEEIIKRTWGRTNARFCYVINSAEISRGTLELVWGTELLTRVQRFSNHSPYVCVVLHTVVRGLCSELIWLERSRKIFWSLVYYVLLALLLPSGTSSLAVLPVEGKWVCVLLVEILALMDLCLGAGVQYSDQVFLDTPRAEGILFNIKLTCVKIIHVTQDFWFGRMRQQYTEITIQV